MREMDEKAQQQINALTNKKDVKSKMATMILSWEYGHPLDAPWKEIQEKFAHEDQDFLEIMKKEWEEHNQRIGGQK